MRRRTTAALILVIAVLAALVATAGAAEDRNADRDAVLSAFEELDFDRPDIQPGVKLHCAGSVDDRGAGSVGCRWEASPDVAVASWQLWNLQIRPERGHRNLVAELRPDHTGYTDTKVKVPAVYLYAVLGLDADGDIIVRSRPNVAVVAPRPHLTPIKLGCHARYVDVVADASLARDAADDSITIAPSPPVVACEWSPRSTVGIAGYHVYRSVDGGGRELIARTGADARSIVDDDVRFGHRYAYVVLGVDADGKTVARSRAAFVSIPPFPRPFDPPVDPRPTDTRPTDTRPTDTRPVDVKPIDILPTDTRPVDVKPTDVRPDVRPSDEARDRPPVERPTDVTDTRPDRRRGDRPSDAKTEADRLADHRTDAVGDGVRDH